MYIRGFDGLRAIALLLVFFTHKTWWGEASQVGFAGVWVFFLLSGFLITGQLSACRRRMESRQTTLRQELATFWTKRMMRIFPAYYILLALLVPYYMSTHREIPGLLYYLTYLSNFFFQAEPDQFRTTFAHFWTLAVEEQFYIFFAPLLLLVPSRFSAYACATVIVASLFRRFWLAHLDVAVLAAYIDSLVNFGILALGGLLYLRGEAIARVLRLASLDRPWIGWIALLVVVASPLAAVYLADGDPFRHQGIYVAGTVAGALLLLNICNNQRSLLTCLLEWRPVAHVGRISYGLYLYNDYVKGDLPERAVQFAAKRLPCAQLHSACPGSWLAHTATGDLLLRFSGFITCFGITLLVAQLSWICIEKPALRLRDRWIAASPRAAPTRSPSEPTTKADNELGLPVDAVRLAGLDV